VGALDLFAKQTFAEETAGVTRGAMAWEMPPELNLSEVRLDGMLLVRDAAALSGLAAPWSEATGHEQIAIENKMPGDHLGVKPLERALLRRQAWQVQRVETGKTAWRGQVPLWMLAPRLPATIRAVRKMTCVAPGCHAVETGSFSFLWIAANELPLREELIPFLIARSGRPLDDFVRWVATRRPANWVLRMVQIVPMSPDLREEMLRYVPRTDDPEIRKRQRHVAEVIIDMNPDLRDPWVAQGIEQGIERGIEKGAEKALSHQFERRLGRPLTDQEHRALQERLVRLGSDRLGDVVFDLAPEALALWLADSGAT